MLVKIRVSDIINPCQFRGQKRGRLELPLPSPRSGVDFSTEMEPCYYIHKPVAVTQEID